MKTRSLVAQFITISALAVATVGVASPAYAENHDSGHTGGGGGGHSGGGGAARAPSHGGGSPGGHAGRGSVAPVYRSPAGYYHNSPTVQRGAGGAPPVRGWNGSYPSHAGVDHRVYAPVYGRGAWGRPGGWNGYHAPYYSYVSVLPWYVGTTWWGGIPYYYADNTYYTYNDSVGQYEVVPPPGNADQGVAAAGPAPDPYVYPNTGQSEEQQATDRYECHRWAVDQTGFDPTRADGGVATSAANEAADAYRRAESACLQGRGYTLR